MAAKKITGREVLAKAIVSCGAGAVFTVVTERLLPVIKTLEADTRLKVVRARDETAAALMADGYTRRAARQSVVLTDSGGRCLAQVCGVTNAWADKSPLISIALCGDAAPDENKGWDRARFDQTAVFSAVTLWRRRVDSVSGIAGALLEGARAGLAGKMGPVHVDIPAGLLSRSVSEAGLMLPEPPADGDAVIKPVRLEGDPDAVTEAIALIKSADKPLILSGGGVRASGAGPDVVRFMEAYGIPGATSMGGLGTIASDHSLCLGSPSYTAGEAFHAAIREADVVLGLGAVFSGLEGFGQPPLWNEKARFIQVDTDPLQVGLNICPEVVILGDAQTVLTQMAGRLETQKFTGRKVWGTWRKYLGLLKADRKKRLEKNASRKWRRLHQGRLAQIVGQIVEKENPLMVIDGGNTPLYAAMYGPSMGPRQAFFPFGMAALGGGIPYAIGVALAEPEKRVILVTGDGSFMYAVQELETMVRLSLPITIFVNNDSAWNMIKALQDTAYERNYVGSCLPDVDYARIARGFGAWGQRVTKEESLLSAYKASSEIQGPAVIDCVTDCKNLPDALVSFGMVEFEGSLTQFNPVRVARSQWMNRDQGLRRTLYQMEYIRKAILGINPAAKRKSGKGA